MLSERISSIGRSWRATLEAVFMISMIVLASTLTWQLTRLGSATTKPPITRPASARAVKPTPLPLPTDPVSIDGAVLMGSKDANLVVIAYSDVQCPYCGVFARNTMPDLEKQFVNTGKVLFAFRHFPLEQLHPFAKPAALAIECAAQQNKAWPMHDRLFANPKELDGKSILATALTVGVADKPFAACMGSEAAAARVTADVASGHALGVTGTPTFFVGARQPNGRVKLLERVAGAVPISQWQASLRKWSTEEATK